MGSRSRSASRGRRRARAEPTTRWCVGESLGAQPADRPCGGVGRRCCWSAAVVWTSTRRAARPPATFESCGWPTSTPRRVSSSRSLARSSARRMGGCGSSSSTTGARANPMPSRACLTTYAPARSISPGSGRARFTAEGVRAFDPLVTPFAVTDYATEEKVLTSPIAAEMLDAVEQAGVRGVAILPGPLQRLGMREPWRTPADLRRQADRCARRDRRRGGEGVWRASGRRRERR